MSYPNEYIIKFYDGLSLAYEVEIIAYNSREAVQIALDGIKGIKTFNKIRVINRGGIYCH
jgi:hypothetical protein